jgi:hypothetical protein
MFITPSPAEKRPVVFFPFANDEPGTQDGPEAPRAARDVASGERWAFTDHRTMADVIAAEGVR